MGIDINYNPKKRILKLYITKYINKILNKFNFNNLNFSKILINNNIKIKPNKKQTKPETIKYF